MISGCCKYLLMLAASFFAFSVDKTQGVCYNKGNHLTKGEMI